MKTWFLYTIAIMMTSVFGIHRVHAHDPWSLESEILFLRMHSAHGASVDNVFGFDPSMRHSLSYLGTSNVGARFTFFEYDHKGTFAAPGGTRLLSLEMKNSDAEIFKRVNLTNLTAVEVGGGIRYSDNAVFFPSRFEPNHFTGLGGFLGLRATTKVGTGGEFYARGKMAMLGGNGLHDGNGINTPQRFDESRTHTELAMGYQHTFNFARVAVTPHFGGEWLSLSDYQVDAVDEHPEADLTLAGFTFGINLTF